MLAAAWAAITITNFRRYGIPGFRRGTLAATLPTSASGSCSTSTADPHPAASPTLGTVAARLGRPHFAHRPASSKSDKHGASGKDEAPVQIRSERP